MEQGQAIQTQQVVKQPAIGFKEIQKPFSLIIEKQAQDKIEFICRKIHKDEWSGPIFYKEEGSFAENNLVIRVVDLFLMDIGVATYTEYSDSPDIISYMIEKDLLDTRIGLVHSHNNMETFFSGTDTATLKQEAMNHDHFVSLIVNNRGTYSAAVTTVFNSKFKEKVEEEYSYNTFDGETITGTDSYEEEYVEKTILWSKMNIIIEGNTYNDDEILERMDYISKEKERIKIANAKVATATKVAIPLNTTRVENAAQTAKTVLKSIRPEDDDPLMGKNKGSEAFVINFPKGEEPVFDQDADVPQIDYDITISDELVDLIAKKLVTGSILVPENNKIDLSKFIPSMEGMYNKVFPSIESYDFFIGSFIESIIFDVKDEHIIGFPDDVVAAIVAQSLVLELTQYPTNKYLEVIIDNLTNFVI